MGKAISLLLCVACAAACMNSPAALLRRYEPAATGFQVCSDFGCARRVQVSFDASEWQRIDAVFASMAQTADEERRQIAEAVALMERLVGEKAGTAKDEPGLNSSLFRWDTDGQLDCIDETYNTTTYLKLFAGRKLLRWHAASAPAARGDFITERPHHTATIAEAGSGSRYTVDSWFGGNGEHPHIVPLQAWLDGWSPAPPTRTALEVRDPGE